MTRRGRTLRDRSAFVVLSGGESRRMGRDKAFLAVGGREMLDRLLDVGRSVCSTCVLVADDPDAHADALARYGWEEEAAPGRAGAFGRGDARLLLVTDRHPGLGPVAGLEAGLEAAPSPLCFAAACDMPFLSAPVVEALLSRLGGTPAGAAGGGPAPGGRAPGGAGGDGAARAVVPVADGRRQPLAAAYTSACVAAARRCVEERELAMESFLGRLDAVSEVDAEELPAGRPASRRGRDGTGPPAGGGAAARAFTNVNRPEELRAARRAARGEGRPGPEDGAR